MGELTPTDEQHLRRAIALAEAARTAGDGPFGSLLVGADGAVLAEERDTEHTDRDVAAHPELKLARWAARNMPVEEARTTTPYTNCQPCGMCAVAIERSGLGRVVFALSTEELMVARPAPTPPAATYVGPVLSAAARAVVAARHR